MSKSFFLITFLSFIILSSEADPSILFIGNSLTYYNTLCNVVKGLAEKLGHKINVKAATNGGKNLIFQSTADNVVNPAKEGGYTYAILQDVVSNFNGENLMTGGKACIDLVKKYSPNAKIIFYEPPPKRDSIEGKNSLLPYYTYYYVKAAREYEAKLAPGGEAFYEVLTKYGLDYHISDGLHPQPLGTFIFACTIYYTIFEGEDFKEFTNADQKYLDSLVNDNVAYTEEGKLQTYDLGVFNLIAQTAKKYADAVRSAVADKSGKTTYTSAAGEYNP